MSYVLAFDLGASSGRAMLGRIHEGKIELEELHRFSNDPVQINQRLYWDILRLFHEIKQALLKAKHRGIELSSIAIDSWAVDFGLLDEAGELLANPFHYRDLQNNEVYEEVVAQIGAERIYGSTGIQLLSFNTLYQLAAMKKKNHPALKEAKHFLMIPSLLRYFLTGEKFNEFTNATTTQFYNPVQDDWDTSLLEQIGIDSSIFANAVQPGTVVGKLQLALCEELGIESVPVIATAEHDTASAVAAVPATTERFAYLSSGTWSLMGTEINQPNLTEQARQHNFTNEGGVNHTFRFLKNIMGLWIIQECKRDWEKQGESYSFAELVELAAAAEPFAAFIDVDDALFLGTGNMPTQIDRYCKRNGQKLPASIGSYARTIFEGLALKYRYTLETMEHLTGERYGGLHIVGGGIQNTLLCQWTANAIQRPVWAGPIEGSAIGNILVQWISSGQLSNIGQARQLVHHSFGVETYNPIESETWNEAYKKFQKITELSDTIVQ